MKIATIITEYNPFHNGHKYQVDKIREMLGEDTIVVAIMSGNFTQRGEIAIADKTTRAKAAVECGVNLVLELPFPFSMSSAEFFAKSGVKIANELKVIDYLIFGSECGDTNTLIKIASNMQTESFTNKLTEETEKKANIGYAALCESVYKELFDNSISNDFFSPNNILAIEYIKAIKFFNSNIKPLTIKREGAGYLSTFTPSTANQSASAIRGLISSNNNSALDYMPKEAKNVMQSAINLGSAPTDESKLDTAVISKLRLNSQLENGENIHDASGGLYNRICSMSKTATTIYSLVSMTETKKYTRARTRRAIWNSYFGVTSSEVRALPEYTQILAMDQKGRSLLKKVKKMTDFPILTKPSSYDKLCEAAKKQKENSDRADAVYDLARKKPISAAFALTFTPYVKD